MRPQNIDPDKAAFSMAPHDEEAYAPVHMNDHDNDHDVNAPDVHGYDNGYGRPSNTTYSDSQDPYSHGAQQDPFASDPYRVSARPGENPFDDNAGYHSQTGGGSAYNPPTAQDAYDDDRPAQFPAGNYDRAVR